MIIIIFISLYLKYSIIILADDTPMLGTNADMMSFFKKEENIDILLSFIFDPFLIYPLDDVWRDTFPTLMTDNRIKDIKTFKIPINTASNIIFPEKFACENGLHLRSFKTVKVISEKLNFRAILIQ